MTRCRRGSPETERRFKPKSRKAVEVFEMYTFTEVVLYLWGVDDLPQGPHQGTIHSHQLLGLDLIGFVQHNPGKQRQCCFEGTMALTSFNLTSTSTRHLILSSWFFRAFITSENSSEMSSLWASNSNMIRSTLSANHSKTAAKS